MVKAFFKSKIGKDILLLFKNVIIYCFGDSITVGQAASDWSTTKLKTYVGLLKTNLTSTANNYAVGGTGVFAMCKSVSANLDQNTNGLITFMSGYNDIRIGGNTASLREKIKGAYRYSISNAFVNNFILPDAVLWTNTGDWAAYSQPVLLGGRANCQRTAVGGTKSRTIYGKNFTFNFFGSNNAVNYQFGSVKITVDGIVYHNVTLNDKTDGLLQDYPPLPYSLNVFGLSSGNHAVLIETIGDVMFNYITILTDVEISNSVIVISPIYSTAWGTNAPYDKGSDVLVDLVTTDLKTIVNEYKAQGLPIVFVNSNTYLNLLTGLDVDGIHPIDSGMEAIYKAIRDSYLIATNNLNFPERVQIAFNSKYNAYQTKTISTAWTPIAKSKNYLPLNADGFIQFDIPNQTDCDFGMIGLNKTNENTLYSNYEYAVFYNGYDAAPNLKSLTNGVLGAIIYSGWRPIGSKVQIGRYGGRIKIRYASDGVTFIDAYDSWGIDTAILYVNLNMIKNVYDKRAYNIQFSGGWQLI